MACGVFNSRKILKFLWRKSSTIQNFILLIWLITCCLLIYVVFVQKRAQSAEQDWYHHPRNHQSMGYSMKFNKKCNIAEIAKGLFSEDDTCGNTRESYSLRNNNLKCLVKCSNKDLMKTSYQQNNYGVMENFVMGKLSASLGCADSVTFATVGDYLDFNYLPELVTRWIAPISFAVYAPVEDINRVVDGIGYLRKCLPESSLIRQYVSFHLYYPLSDASKVVSIGSDFSNKTLNCQNMSVPFACDNEVLPSVLSQDMGFPANIGRNIARQAVNTHFVLSADVNLSPSGNLVEEFLDFLVNEKGKEIISNSQERFVFSLNAYEIPRDVGRPATKSQLLELLLTNVTVSIISQTDDFCQNQVKTWLNSNKLKKFAMSNNDSKSKDQYACQFFFISDNQEPKDNEEEYHSDHDANISRMENLGYKFYLLHPAFLIKRVGYNNINCPSEE